MRAIRFSRSSRTTVMKVTSPSTRRSDAFNSVVSWMLAAWIEPML